MILQEMLLFFQDTTPMRSMVVIPRLQLPHTPHRVTPGTPSLATPSNLQLLDNSHSGDRSLITRLDVHRHFIYKATLGIFYG